MKMLVEKYSAEIEKCIRQRKLSGNKKRDSGMRMWKELWRVKWEFCKNVE